MKNKILIAIILIIVVAGVGFGVLYWQISKIFPVTGLNNLVQEQKTDKQNNATSNMAADENYFENIKKNWTPNWSEVFIPKALPKELSNATPTPNIAVSWSSRPKLLTDLKLILGYNGDDYNPSYPIKSDEIKYYDMGYNGINKIILAIAPPIDIGGPLNIFFELDNERYIFMEKISNYGIYSSETKEGYLLSSKVIDVDKDTYYQGLLGPENLNYHGLQLSQPYLYITNLFENEYSDSNLKKVETFSFGDLYLNRDTYQSAGNPTNFYINNYILKLPSGFYTNYDVNYDFFSDDYVPNITWIDGTKNKDYYREDGGVGGCGLGYAYLTFIDDVSADVQQIGTTGSGWPIYEFKDYNNPAVKFFYNLSSGEFYNLNTGEYESISIESWYTHHPVIIYKNPLGEYVIFSNENYGLQAECAKPVIYLYPTQPTKVKVKVGADISRSEPIYNNGWQVLAVPDGKLLAEDGATYDYLFWDGLGWGNYPIIKDGFVVAQNDLEETLALHLTELGLSKKESADFLEFWLPKMPNTPYVRLTWFNTDQVNRLAPLAIWPKPDTIIRIFLDFQGLQNPVLLPIQKLTALPREGFTVIEWGGLLRK